MMQLIYTLDSGQEASIIFDATLSEDHVAEAIIPEHPVEDGVNISDHIRPALNKLSARVHVTNTPIRQPKNLEEGRPDRSAEDVIINLSNQELFRVTHNRIVSRAFAAKGPSLSLRVGFDEVQVRAGIGDLVVPAVSLPSTDVFAVVTHRPTKEFDRVRTVYNSLVEHRAAGTLFRVLTALREYDNMVIERVGAPRSVEDGDAVTISLELREVRFAEVQIGESLEPNPAPERGRPERNRGNQNPEEQDGNEDAQNQSWLSSLLSAAS